MECCAYHGALASIRWMTKQATNENKTNVQHSLGEERHVGRLQPPDTLRVGFSEILQKETFEAQTNIIGFVSST